MIRVVADTQSNAHFLGSAMEQAYDQRGGLCQLDSNGILITANQIDPDFLAYWQEIGFELPTLIVAGPSDGNESLSELIMKHPNVRDKIHSVLAGRNARLEFFCIEETERRLANYLGIEPYCTFDIAIPYSRKPAARRLFSRMQLATPLGIICKTMTELEEFARPLLANGTTLLVKAQDGTGGIACNGMHVIESESILDAFLADPPRLGLEFVVEKRIQVAHEVSVHWEINTDGELALTGVFNQYSPNLGYQGASWPPSIPITTLDQIEQEVRTAWSLALSVVLAIGYFCCDVIVDQFANHYWIDFNPRKGAIRYVHDLAARVARTHFGQEQYGSFVHEHIKLPKQTPYTFRMIHDCLGDLLTPSETTCIVASNPGVISYGYVDITGIAKDQNTDLLERFEKTRKKLLTL